MPYSQADLDSVKAARVELAVNKRVVSVTVGNQTTLWERTRLSELYELERQIAEELARAAGGSSHLLASASKGL